MMSEKIKVVIADDQYVARGFFEMYLKMSPDYELAASVATAEQAVNYCRRNPADLVIMDVMMRHGLDGLTCAEMIKNNNPRIRIILATSTAEYQWIEKARKVGIESFWFKEYGDEPLLSVMDRTMAGERVWPDQPPTTMLGHAHSTDFTDRELDVLRLLVEGLTDREISERLFMSVSTVRYHVTNLIGKTGYSSRTELAVNAVRSGITIPEIQP
jgi:DNA-binding NarL/FixJ family response regulator